MTKEKQTKEKKQMKDVELKGKCLKCLRPMFKNHQSCRACNRKKRLRSKANRRGRDKNYYLNR